MISDHFARASIGAPFGAQLNHLDLLWIWVVFLGCGNFEGAQSPIIYQDVTERIGLDVVHDNGRDGHLYLVEIMGPGGAFFDYDGDGDQDLYVGQGGPLGKSRESEPLGDRLFRNDGVDSEGLPRLVDVTESSGIRAFGYSMGVTTGDYDNDGCVDFYLTNFGANELWHNRCDGHL